jgi:hypothetical protein
VDPRFAGENFFLGPDSPCFRSGRGASDVGARGGVSEEPLPAAVRISPVFGSICGGEAVELRGRGLDRIRSVSIDGRAIRELRAGPDNTLQGLTPPGTRPGGVPVEVDDGETVNVIWGAFVYARDLLRGDIDASGRVDISDVISLATWVLLREGAPYCDEVGDVDLDADVDIGDAIWLAQYLFGGERAIERVFVDCRRPWQ